MQTGRRLIFHAPLHSGWEDITAPVVLGPYEILIQAHYSLISAGTELALATASHITFSYEGGNTRRYPYRPGYTVVGQIAGLGEQVSEFLPAHLGDRVLASTHHSSIAVIDVRRTLTLLLPDGLTDTQALLSRMGAISTVGIRMGQVKLGDQVVVIGQGLIGHLAAQLARAAGGRPVIGIDRLASRLALTEANGITPLQVVDDENAAERVRSLTDGRGADVVIEATGNPQAIPLALTLVAPLGRVVLLGSPRGKVEIDPYLFIHKPGVQVIGAHNDNSHRQETRELHWTERRNVELNFRLFMDGTLQDRGLISTVVPADEALDIHARLHAYPEQFMGVMIDWTREG